MTSLKRTIKQLWKIINELEETYPERKFTIDGLYWAVLEKSMQLKNLD